MGEVASVLGTRGRNRRSMRGVRMDTNTGSAVGSDVAPSWRDPERRRRVLLDAAILEFSTYGLGGARVDRIAERAHTNKAMVYHYFGSKEDLYLAAPMFRWHPT